MPFAYTVSLDVTDRATVVFGGGPMAAERAEGLLRAGARVRVVTPEPGPALAPVEQRVTLDRRDYRRGDLDGVFLAYATREEPQDTAAMWAEADAGGVLFSAADEVAHCHFGATATVRRGDLVVSIGTAGRAPAVAGALRRRLDADLSPAWGDLVDVVAEARAAVGRRRIPFEAWAQRWRAALADPDALVARLASGDRDGVRADLVEAVAPPVAGPAV